MAKRRRAADESGSEFDQFTNALADLLDDYPAMKKKVDVLVDVRDEEEFEAIAREFLTKNADAGESTSTAFANAAGPCPNCVPPRRCVFNARTRRWRCFP
jgi:hypothetical protein